MEFSRQEYWSGLVFLSPADRPDSGIEPWSPALQTDSLPSEPPGRSIQVNIEVRISFLVMIILPFLIFIIHISIKWCYLWVVESQEHLENVFNLET